MADRLGLDPLAVTSALGRLAEQLVFADNIADDFERVSPASVAAADAGVISVGLVIGVGSGRLARSAVADIRSATDSARRLIEAIRAFGDDQNRA